MEVIIESKIKTHPRAVGAADRCVFMQNMLNISIGQGYFSIFCDGILLAKHTKRQHPPQKGS